MCATIVLCSNEHVLVCVCVICAHLPRGLPTFASKDGGLTINVLPVFGDLDDLKFLAPAGTRRLRDQVQKREPADLGWASPLPSTCCSRPLSCHPRGPPHQLVPAPGMTPPDSRAAQAQAH